MTERQATMRYDPAEIRIVAEDADKDIAKADADIDHWTVFPSGDDWTVLGEFPTRAEAEAFVRGLTVTVAGFRRSKA